MELNEMEKRLPFQVEGDYQSKVLNELHMTARYIKNAEQKEAARRVIYRVNQIMFWLEKQGVLTQFFQNL